MALWGDDHVHPSAGKTRRGTQICTQKNTRDLSWVALPKGRDMVGGLLCPTDIEVDGLQRGKATLGNDSEGEGRVGTRG